MDLPACPERWAGAVLAAGSATRFGGGKLTASLGGRPLAARPVEAALAAGLGRVAVIIGAGAAELSTALPAHPRLTLLPNPDHAAGMGTSLALAARWALEGDWEGLTVILGDQPFHSPDNIRRISLLALESPAGAAAARCQGRRTHPVAFTRRHLEKLAGLGGEKGGRDILDSLAQGMGWLEVPAAAAFDVDTREDLREAARLLEGMEA